METTKKCFRCLETLPLSSFAKNKSRPDGLQAQCRTCNNWYAKRDYERHKDRYFATVASRKRGIREWLNDLKKGPCVDCGVAYGPEAMDFDHLGDKEFGIADMIRRNFSKERIAAEITKCELVCAVCHRLRTAARRAF
jgi:hypothetical protein